MMGYPTDLVTRTSWLLRLAMLSALCGVVVGPNVAYSKKGSYHVFVRGIG